MMTDEAEARHQRVRDFVQGKYSHCRVTEVVEEARTHYKRKLHSDEHVLAGLDVKFRVEVLSQDRARPSIRCTVHPMQDGSFRVADEQYVFFS